MKRKTALTLTAGVLVIANVLMYNHKQEVVPAASEAAYNQQLQYSSETECYERAYKDALDDSKAGYMIYDAEELNKEVRERYSACGDLVPNAQAIADEYAAKVGGKPVEVVFIPEKHYDICGKEAAGCTWTDGFDKIYLRVSGFYYGVDTTDFGLRRLIAHEYIHTLTSDKEGEWLDAPKRAEFFTTAREETPPVEVIADCGIHYFTEPDWGTTYVPEGCSEEWEAIAVKVIEDTLVK